MRRPAGLIGVGILGSVVFCILHAVALGQSAENWTIDQPTSALEIVRVEHLMTHVYRLTLRNVSGKAILGIAAVISSSPSDRNTVSIDPFIMGQAAEPGSTETLLISSVDSSIDPSRNDVPERYELHISAIVFADGSTEGNKQDVDMMIGRNLGYALEIKRDADLLAAVKTSGDPAPADLDALTMRIGPLSPRSIESSVGSVRSVNLPGVSQAFINASLSRPNAGLHGGINNAREVVLRELDRVWLASDLLSPSEQAKRAREGHYGPLSLLAMSEEYRALSEKQIQLLRAFTARSKY